MRGVMIIGTPPVARDNIAQGFIASAHRGAASREHLSDVEIDAFVQAIYGKPIEPFLRDAAKRADGRFRKRVIEAAREGKGLDQRQIVATISVPLAVVNGAADPLINLDYIDTVDYANLWERCYRLTGLGHAPFWEAPDTFAPYLERFLRSVAP